MNTGTKKSAVTLRLTLILIGLIGLGWGAVLHLVAFRSADSTASITAPRHKGSLFVFADLDGDRIPDLASVETRLQRSANSDYAIRVKLSAGAESAIGISGPLGGLRVAARDVNGDNIVDLIVTADLDAGFMKVFLNDGHGNFSVAAASEFLRNENEGELALHTPAGILQERGLLAPIRSPYGENGIQPSASDQPLSSEACGQPAVRAVLQRTLLSRFGRSPPLSVSFS
jgi:hypothetical protein